MWIAEYLGELGIDLGGPVNLMCDSQSAIMLMRNPVLHQSTKHIRIQAHFIREKYKSGEINLRYVETRKQVADFLTKSMTREKLEFCRDQVGVK
jgi:ATP sulfurylase